MSAYLVRLIDGREIVGVFSCDSLNELAQLVDECAETRACEYRTMPIGGVIWKGAEGPKVPCRPAVMVFRTEAALTGMWRDTMADAGREKTWRRVPDHQGPQARAFATG